MRLWHYELIKYLPDELLIKQWKQLRHIFKEYDTKKDNLVSYINQYTNDDLYYYSLYIISEMNKRKIKILHLEDFKNYFDLNNNGFMRRINFEEIELEFNFYIYIPYKYHHTDQYLLQGFFNLQELYNRKVDYMTDDLMEKLVLFITKKFEGARLYDLIMFKK